MIYNLKSTFNINISDLRRQIDLLSDELRRKSFEKDTTSTEVENTRTFKESLKPIIPLSEQEIIPVLQPEEEVQPVKEEIVSEPTQEQIIKEETKVVYKEGILETQNPSPSFFERNPDLEKFIGENLANKIGIGILVVGIGFFVKYAIDQNWINEIGRVFIGILCGGILLGVAHRLRKTFNTFSSVLVGGGIAVLYLTITIAFQEYHIFSQTAAFAIMAVITAFTVFLSLGYNKIELAILAILGGFGSPFMVSTGEGNYVVLFTYMLVLNVGMLALAYFKKWNLVNIISYVLTLILFGSWLASKFNEGNVSMIRGSMIFSTLFYLIFFAMNIINNLKERTAFKAMEFGMLLSNTFFYYAAGMFILNNDIGINFRGLFTTLLGVFNFGFAYVLFRNSRVDRNLVFLLIGLVLTFISLAAPIQLEGNYITLFWSAEAVLLLWLSQKSGIKLMKIASYIVLFLMLISLIMDWNNIYILAQNTSYYIMLNKGYITSAVSLISLTVTFSLMKNETDSSILNVRIYKTALALVFIIVLYIANLIELRYHLDNSTLSWPASTLTVGIYNMLFILGLLLAEPKLFIPEDVRVLFAGFGVLAVLSYFAMYEKAMLTARDNFLSNSESFLGFALHYVLLVLLVFISALTIIRFRKLTELNAKTYNMYAWLYVIFFVVLASEELDNSVLLLLSGSFDSMDYVLIQNHKIGFPILWGLSSFILIAVGLKKKNKTLRIISLTMFLITLLKLFLIDIRGISEGGKIAAFISLGILLLIVSFMYQRLKKLLLADEVAGNQD